MAKSRKTKNQPSPAKVSTPVRNQRRRERANVEERLQGVELKCSALSTKPIKVLNISEFGVGINTSSILESPNPESVLEAKLMVGRSVAPLKIRLVHMATVISGFEFVEPSDLLRGAIRQYFEPELIGASMIQVAQDLERPQLCRFESKLGSRFAVTLLNNEVETFSIEVMGNVIQWDRGADLRLVQNGRNEKVSGFFRKQMMRLIQNIEGLPPSIQSQIEHTLLGLAR